MTEGKRSQWIRAWGIAGATTATIAGFLAVVHWAVPALFLWLVFGGG